MEIPASPHIISQRGESLDAELVAFRIEHHDPILASFFDFALPRRPKTKETVDFHVHLFLAGLKGYSRATAGVDVDVQTVLPQLRGVHLLKVYARSVARRIDNRARGVPVFLRDAPSFQKFFPGLESIRRVLKLVLQYLSIEARERCGVSAIEDNLHSVCHSR